MPNRIIHLPHAVLPLQSKRTGCLHRHKNWCRFTTLNIVVNHFNYMKLPANFSANSSANFPVKLSALFLQRFRPPNQTLIHAQHCLLLSNQHKKKQPPDKKANSHWFSAYGGYQLFQLVEKSEFIPEQGRERSNLQMGLSWDMSVSGALPSGRHPMLVFMMWSETSQQNL